MAVDLTPEQRTRGLRRLTGGPAPGLVDAVVVTLIVAVAFAVTAVWVRSIHTFSVMPDELGYVKQALQIARTGLPLTQGDFYFNSWAQLLPLLLSPVYGLLGIVNAFYTAHTLCALMLASTAIPTFLLARATGLPRAAAHLAAVLAVTVPWLALSGLIMTEDVAYPVFVWTILALVRAISEPSPRRDAVALVTIALAFTARTQFVILGPVFVLGAIAVELRAPRADWRRVLRDHRVLWSVAALAALAAVAATALGQGGSIFGSYITAVRGPLVPSGAFSAGLEQLDGIILAVGVVPAIAFVSWLVPTLWAPRSRPSHAFAVVAGLTIVVLVIMVGSFQATFLAGDTTDRYLFYIAPLLEIGMLAWATERRGTWPVLLIAIVLAGASVIDNELHAGVVSIIDPSFAFHRVLQGQGGAILSALGLGSLDPRVLVAVVAGLAAVTAAVLRGRIPPVALVVVLVLPVFAYQAAATRYVMRKLTDEYAGITAAHPRELTWIDRAVGRQASVGLVLAQSGTPENTYFVWWQPAFWNASVRHSFVLPGAGSLGQGFAAPLTPDLATGRLMGVDGSRWLVMLADDHRFRIVTPIQRSYGAMLLDRVDGATPQLLYATQGVGDDQTVPAAAVGFVRFFAPTGSPLTARASVTVRLPAPVTGCPCRLGAPTRLAGGGPVLATGAAGATATVSERLRVAGGGHRDLSLGLYDRSGHAIAAARQLLSVTVRR